MAISTSPAQVWVSRSTAMAQVLLTVFSVVAYVPVSAQQTSAPSAPGGAASAADSVSLERVVITANKRLQRSRDVAGSVQAVQGAELENRGAISQEDIFRLTPGVQMSKGEASYNNIVIRGLATSGCSVCQGALQNPTGLYLEDVPLTDPVGKLSVPDVYPWDLERVEILKGPQGALYGSASLSGAVRYILAKPDLSTLFGSVLAGPSFMSGGKTGYTVAGMVNVPLSKGVAALRVTAYDVKEGGYLENPGAGVNDANKHRLSGARVLASIKPTTDLSATFTLLTQRTRQGDGDSIVEGNSVRPDPGAMRHNSSVLSPRTQQFNFASLVVNYDFLGHTLTSTTGWWNKRFDQLWDLSPLYGTLAIPVPLGVTTGDRRSEGHAGSQEVRIANQPGSALSYVTGAIIQYANSPIDENVTVVNSTLFAPINSTSTGFTTARERAVFFDGEYRIGGGWSIGAGARHYWLKSQSFSTFNGAGGDPTGDSESGTTPKFTVKYKFGDNLWYGLASKGYRFGGQNPAPTFLNYKTDSVWNYETGVKLTPLQDFNVDFTIYRLNWSQAQFTFVLNLPAPQLPQTVTGNVGRATIDGIETAIQYRFNQAFNVGAVLAYTDARTAADVTTGFGLVTSGTELPNVGRFQGAAQANYRFAGPLDSQGRFNVTVSRTGSRSLVFGGGDKVPGYNQLDLGLVLTRTQWTLLTNLANVTNSHGLLSDIAGAPPPNRQHYEYFIQRPRTLSIAARYDF